MVADVNRCSVPTFHTPGPGLLWMRRRRCRVPLSDHEQRLLEQMEKSGLVSSMATNGNRDIIVPRRDDPE